MEEKAQEQEVAMKTKREMPLAEALEQISSTVQRLKEEGAARANGSEVRLDDPVTLEIETESRKGKGELEFEIKWPTEVEAGRQGKREGRQKAVVLRRRDRHCPRRRGADDDAAPTPVRGRGRDLSASAAGGRR
jgi:hypothetical protein